MRANYPIHFFGLTDHATLRNDHALCTISIDIHFIELAGKKEYMNYQAFISEYAEQLRKVEEALDETLGEAWDFNLDPISLQVEL